MAVVGFSKKDAKRISAVVQDYEGRPPKTLPNRRSITSQNPNPRIFARITGWQVITTGTPKWRYAAEQVVLNDADDWVVLPPASGGRVWTLPAQPPPDPAPPPNYLLNIIEANNVASGTQGNSVNDSRTSYPAGFSMQPVGGGTAGVPANQVVVLVFSTRDAADPPNVRWLFAYENADDGDCA